MSCPAAPPVRALGADAGLVSVAPGNLRATVSGNAVRLDWNPVLDAVASHLIEVGSNPGLSNLTVFNTGNAVPGLSVAGVPAGVYYVRVRAIGGDNVPGPPSNEVAVSVGSCTTPPSAPTNLSAQVAGTTVNLSWTAPSGDAPASYVIEAGSAAGLANLVVFDTGAATPALTAVAPTGIYFLRVRGRNACGAGPVSNELIVPVNQAGTPSVPTEPPWTPPPGPELPGPPLPVRALVSEIVVSVAVAEPPQVILGSAPLPNIATGPAVSVTQIGAPTAATRRVRVTSSTPIDTLIVAADTRVSALTSRTMAATDSYYLIRLLSPQTVFELTLAIAQAFTAQFAARLGAGPVGGYTAQPLAPTLGTGMFRATLTWDTTADIDLHVIEPDGSHVYFAAPTGSTLLLDVDDVTGFGPENIFSQSNVAAGTYQVFVNHYEGVSPTNSTITITINAGTANARSMTLIRTTTSTTATVNVANVDVLNGVITASTGGRSEASLEAAPAKGPGRRK